VLEPVRVTLPSTRVTKKNDLTVRACSFLERLGARNLANKLQGPNMMDTAGVPDFSAGFEPMAPVIPCSGLHAFLKNICWVSGIASVELPTLLRSAPDCYALRRLGHAQAGGTKLDGTTHHSHPPPSVESIGRAIGMQVGPPQSGSR
jgi:hypothetical protein